MKRILITGKGSYIGESVKDFLMQYPESYEVDIIDTIGLVPTVEIFRGYDVVFNAAGIAHIKETKQNRDLYYKVNR
ncbi:MAG: NAD-dependent epimerase, partial [Ruminococcus sp.]|nr:NAD-dependent epimerase [Ruminococcus sp.]